MQGEILNLLADLRERLGLTIVLICQHLVVVRQVADRVAVLYLGRIVEEGPVGEVLSQPLHPYTRALLAASLVPDPDDPARPLELSGEVCCAVPAAASSTAVVRSPKSAAGSRLRRWSGGTAGRSATTSRCPDVRSAGPDSSRLDPPARLSAQRS